MKLTREQLWDARGHFIADGGKLLESDPPDDAVFFIMAGPWPSRNVGARQARCRCCSEFVGLSPKGWELHQRNPKRDILCCDCFVMVNEIYDEMEKGVN